MKLKYTKSKLVLFDIDQTLISSGGAGSRALYAAVEKYTAIREGVIKAAGISFAGKTDPQIIEEILLACESEIDKSQGLSRPITEILDLYLQLLPQSIAETEDYFLHEGVNEILLALQENKQTVIGLLTGNVQTGARLKLERVGINHFFPIGSFGSDSPNRLDLPAIANRRAQVFYNTQFRPDQIVIIGDAENDVLCAKHYGAVSIAVTTGKTTWEELNQHNPDYIFSSLKDTGQIMQAILTGRPSYSAVE
jgi:phosphoglycolate phosphatase-like HAD superfamily hydrolase